MKPLLHLILTLGATALLVVYFSNNMYAKKPDYKRTEISKTSTIELNDDKMTSVISDITSSTPNITKIITPHDEALKLHTQYTIPSKGKVILANLDRKTIDILEDGNNIKSINIVSIGKPNKYYETPGGVYKIKSWETSHYSSLGHVYMPWSMQFSGNYFIHGIPYYEDGERVSTEYSGGCIRLEDDDAKFIYDFSDKSTYVFVVKNDDDDSILTDDDSSDLSRYLNNYKDKKYLALDLSNNWYYTNANDLSATDTESSIANIIIALTNLDYISQERKIRDENGNEVKQLSKLGDILQGDLYYKNKALDYVGRAMFQAYANTKIKSIGLESTDIDVSNSKSTTTLMDMMYTIRYIYIYKPYIMSLDDNSGTDYIWQYDLGTYQAEIIRGPHRNYLIIYK